MKTLKFLIILLLLITTKVAYNQSVKIEEYIQMLKDAKAEQKPEIYYFIADEYYDSDLELSEEYALEGIKSLKKIENNEVAADLNALLGAIYLQNNEYKDAAKSYEKELEYRLLLKNNSDIGICYYNIATAYQNNSNEKKAIDAYENCLSYAKISGNKDLTLQIYETLFNLNVKNKNYEDAYKYFKLCVEIKDSTFKINTNQELIILRKQKQEKEEELNVANKNINSLNSTLNNVSSTLKSTKSTLSILDSTLSLVSLEKAKLDTLTKEQRAEIVLLNTKKALYEEQIKTQNLKLKNMVMTIIFLSVLTIIIFILFLYKRKINKKLLFQNNVILQQNEEIKAQNEEIRVQTEEIEYQKNAVEQQRDEIEKQRDEIAKKNLKITDSILYAEKIQSTIMPPVEIINDYFPENFIFFKPKDIVSGDFYWFTKIYTDEKGIHINEKIRKENDLFIFTAADCTGHGVPGAFMSMLGISFLNQTVFVNQVFNADEILNTVREKIKKTLRQTAEMFENKDGMDMAMCVFDRKNMKLQYAGANNPMFLIRNCYEDGECQIVEYECDYMPVGIQSENDPPFKNNVIDIKEGDTCYIFSDGYFDQFGGPNGKKFLQKNFEIVAQNIQKNFMNEQVAIIEKIFYDWKGKKEQVDDVLVMGVRF